MPLEEYAGPALPLAGVRVLDLTRALSGPFCAMILGDLGADVVKVEPLAKGDMVREWGPFDRGVSAYYLSANRNKRGIAVNFRDPRGLELIRGLASSADVLVENFRTGVTEEMGLDYQHLARANRGLVYGSITGFGSTGPSANWPGFDQIAQGQSGLMSLTGTEAGGPLRVGVPIGDLTSGMWLAMGILAALRSRDATGQGQRVETSLLASLVSLLGVQGQRYLSLGEVPRPTGNDHPVIAPYGTFQTQDGPLNLAPATQAMWVSLCNSIGMPGLADDPRFIDNRARVLHRVELRRQLEAGLAARTRAEWVELFLAKGIPAGPINDLSDVFRDPQVLHGRLVQEIEHPEIGALKQAVSPIGLGGSPQGSLRMPPPLLGQHSFAVLSESGHPREKLLALEREGVIFQHLRGLEERTRMH